MVLSQHIYAWDLWKVVAVSAVAVLVWALVAAKVRRGHAFRLACIVLSVLSVVVVLQFSAFGREATGEHVFVWVSDVVGEEFLREMVMNAFLYVPLGLFLPFAFQGMAAWAGSLRNAAWPGARQARTRGGASLKPLVASIIVAAALSVGVESWQYLECTGIAQGTDTLCNVIGAAFGGISFLISGSRT